MKMNLPEDPRLSYVEEETAWNNGCLCENGEIADWIRAQFKIYIIPNENGSAYNVDIYTRLASDFRMEWNGAGHMTVTVTWTGTDGSVQQQTSKVEVTTPLYGAGQQSDWSGPASFSFTTYGAKTLQFDICQDLLRTACNGGAEGWCPEMNQYVGPHYNTGETHFQYFYHTHTINVEGIPLGSAPIIGNLRNAYPYNGNPLVSDLDGAIGIAWDHIGGNPITKAQYRWMITGTTWSNWLEPYYLDHHTLYSIKPGMYITFEVQAGNEFGWGNVVTITIRHKYAPPTVLLSLTKTKLEQLIFNWTSDISLKSTEYRIDNGTWTNLGQTGKSGSITARWFDPSSEHTIYFRGVANDEDAQRSKAAHYTATTLGIARITGPTTNPIFGNSIAFTFSINSSDIRPLKLQIWTEGNGKSPRITLDPVSVTNNGNTAKYTFTPTQSQLDEMYKCYTNSNQIDIHYLLTTKGENKNWNDTQKNYKLVLTGIAKTAHVGVSNKQRRAQAFIGVNGKPRRAVCWVGVNGKARRCI